MKSIKIVQILCFLSVTAYAAQDPIKEEPIKEYEQLVQDHEAACRKTLDAIFAQAKTSIEVKEDIITPEWLSRQEIKDIKNHMSDACIELMFDCNAKNVIPEKMQNYLQTKIRNEAEKIFENKDIDVDQIQQFFYLSELLCGLNKGTDCHVMMRAIKDENFPYVQNIKLQKKIKRQIKKEERRDLCMRIVLGAQPRR